MLFWIEHGVRIFRVDNPHTKPFAFWEWLHRRGASASIPDVIFLSEAFTRPEGDAAAWPRSASRSRTRTSPGATRRPSSTEYFTELTQTPVARVLPAELLGRTRPTSCTSTCRPAAAPAFQIRLVLAATLGANYGIYGPRLRAVRARAARAGHARSTSTPRSTRCGTGTSTRPTSLRALDRRG